MSETTLESTSAEPSAAGSINAPIAQSEMKPSASDANALDVKPNANEYIKLRIITSDMTNEVHFRIKAAVPLGRLKHSYCTRLGVLAAETRFMFDGHRITDDDTPQQLEMLNDDVIEVYQERSGGGM